MASKRATPASDPGQVKVTAGADSSSTAPQGKDTPQRQQLERLLASTTFRQVDRLKRFLNFIVCEAIAGRSDQLKEYVIGVQVFDKESSFDPRADPIVRVQARRLRARLLRYYREEARPDELVIELPKGGYAPSFKRARDRRILAALDRRRADPAEHDRGAAVCRPQRRRRPRVLLSVAAPGDHHRPGVGRVAACARLGSG